VPLLVASLTLRPWQIWLVLLFNVVGLTLTILALPYNPLTDRFDSQAVSSGFALLVVITLMSFLGAKTTSNALRGAEQARKEAEVGAQALERANASLETTVAERTRSLEDALQAVEQREARLVQTLAENELQRVTIREMSVPVIPVSTTTVVMPLIGTLDTARLAGLQTQAIRSIERTGTRYLVLDITGVPIFDSQVAKGFLEVVQAARLLGSEAILVGIRLEVAQTVVGLGLDLRAIRTFSDLQSALARLDEHHTHASAPSHCRVSKRSRFHPGS
jgi:rsbT co-antagonist protein RsbR